MKTIFRIGFILLALQGLLTSCTKSKTEPDEPSPTGYLKIDLSHEADSQKLVFDTLIYQNLAGNKYEVTKLHYYLSHFTFVKSGGEEKVVEGVYYCDGRTADLNHILDKVPVGTYTAIRFNIGIDEAHNHTNSLDNTIENINMQWPDAIGGGYHFLKFEGSYLDSIARPTGFAVHLGGNPTLVMHKDLPLNLTITENDTASVAMVMEVNEWFKNPYTYNLAKDGNYTMAVAPLMELIKNNGYDVFKIKP